MKISYAELKNVIHYLFPIVPMSSTLPILENICITTKDNRLVLNATDLDIYVTGNVKILEQEKKEKVNGCLPAKKLKIALESFTGDIVELKQDKKIIISCGKSKHTFNFEPVDDYPVPEFEGTVVGTMDKDFIESLIKLLPFVDKSGFKKYFEGIRLENNKMIATDGYKMAMINMDIGKLEVTVPKGCIKILTRLNNCQILLNKDKSEIQFKSENISITSKLIDEMFPKYESVIPKNNKYYIIVNRAEFLQSLKVAGTNTDKETQRIFIDINDTTEIEEEKRLETLMFVTGEDLEYGNESEYELSCKTNANMSLAFNVNYLKEAISVFDDETLKLEFQGNSKATIIKNKNKTVLIMPIKAETERNTRPRNIEK